MSRYQAYPDYKNSGVDWLSSLPSGWKLSPLKSLATFSGGGTPSKDNPNYWNGDIPWVSPKDMKTSKISSTIDNVTEIAVKQSSTNLLKEGALLMVVRSGILQHSIPVAINSVPVTLNQDMKALRFNSRLSVEYAMYVISGNQKLLLFLWGKQGATVESIEQEYLANTFFPVPSISEQEKIVNFLDHETAKIDTLIEKQQQLIQLLKEKRQAVISHAVTKGLNPNAPMKDSGVEWLGNVPEHWGIGKIKNLSLVISKGTTPSTMGAEFESSGIRFLKAENIGKGFYAASQPEFYISKQTDEQLARSRLKDKDVLVIIAGATTGQASLMTEELLPANTNQAVSFIRPLNSVYSEYISYWLSTEYSQSNIWQNAVQAAQPNLSMETLGNIYIPIPPEKEVRSLILEIQKQLLRFAKVIENAEQAIQFMQERRTALISAAVTGKIDVRDWQAQQN